MTIKRESLSSLFSPPPLRAKLKRALGRAPAGRHFAVLPGDIMLVSYPRSGSTWLRFLVGNLIFTEEPTTFANIERRVADIYVHRDEQLQRMPRPRILKSHEYYDPRYRKVLCLVRDPRDIALSYYRWHIKVNTFSRDFAIQDFVDRFLRGGWDSFGPWSENVGSWLGAKSDDGSLLLVKYESLVANPVAEMARVAEFLNIAATSSALDRAVTLSSDRQMRRSELAEGHEWRALRHTRTDTPFIGPARVGQWRTALPVECAAGIYRTWSSRIGQLGYAEES